MAELIQFHIQDSAGLPVSGALVQGDGVTKGHWQGLTNPCGDFSAMLDADHYALTVSASGLTTRTLPADLANSGIVTIGLEGATRPAPQPRAPLPPFDASDASGAVHTTLPPEQTILGSPYDRDRWRGDFSGVMLPIAPPFVPGANTTPPEMTISFLLPHYVQFGTKQIDAFLTAHAIRDYSHFHFDRLEADRAGLSLPQFMDLIDYVQSWGFLTSAWACSSGENRSGGWPMVQPVVEPFLQALASSSRRADSAIVLVGEELNNGTVPGAGANSLDPLIANVCAITNPAGIPTWLHFTSNYPAWIPPTPPAQFDAALIAWIAQWTGRIRGLCWQSDPSASAGLMGAKLWDARRYYNSADPSMLVSAFELLATEKLYGRCTEDYGCLRGWEMICCTRDNPNPSALAVAGSCDGLRQPSGRSV